MNQNFSFQCIEGYIILLKKDGSKIMRKHLVKLVAVGYVGFSTKDDFEKATGATTVKTLSMR